MNANHARELLILDENLVHVRKRMGRIFLFALFMSVLVSSLLLRAQVGLYDKSPFSVGLSSILFWSLITTAYAFNAMREFSNQLAVQLAKNQFLDTLTEVYNFRFMRMRMKEEELRVRRYGGTAGALYIDLDRFKEVNDTYGHHVGNVLLQEIAASVVRRVRETDIVGRIGGDEFLVLLPNADLEAARVSAVRLAEGIGDLTISVAGIGEIEFAGLSIGVGSYPETGDCMDCVVAGADKASYTAKQQDKPRVALAPPYEPLKADAADAS